MTAFPPGHRTWPGKHCTPAASPTAGDHPRVPTAPAPASTAGRRHGWLAVLVVGVALFLVEERTLVATQNPNLVPSAILLGASIVPLAFVAFVYGRRLPYDVPGWAIATAAFLGGVIGTIVAATLEFDVLRDLGGMPMLGVGSDRGDQQAARPAGPADPAARQPQPPPTDCSSASRAAPGSPRWRPWATPSPL